MEINPVDPRVAKYDDQQPNYWVIFWSQLEHPNVPSEEAGWHSSEYRLTGAKDVHEVIAWASADRHQRAYTLYLESNCADNGVLISRLSGTDPTLGDSYSIFLAGGATVQD